MLNINPYNILWTVINLLILFAAVKIFLLKPINNIIAKRQELADQAFAEAKAKEDDAEKVKKQYEDSMQSIEDERKKILADARTDADAQVRQILEQADAQAAETLKTAHENAERDKKKMYREAEHEITELIIAASSKVAASKMPEGSDKDLYEQFIQKAGDQN